MFSNSSKKQNAKDIDLKGVPSQSISSINWSPTANHLAASSWDGLISVWDAGSSDNIVTKMDFQTPVLSCCWNDSGSRIFSGDCDNCVRVWDIESNKTEIIGKHNAPVKCVFYEKQLGDGLLVTGSWDKTIRYWDFRQQEAAAVVELPERLYTMDCSFPVLVAGCATNDIIIYDLNNPTKEFKRIKSPLTRQIRATTLFKDRDGVFIGSIDGRCSVKYFEETSSKKTFQFKCHRENKNVYSLNQIAVNPRSGSFVTCGGDGKFFFGVKRKNKNLATPANLKMQSAVQDIIKMETSLHMLLGMIGNKGARVIPIQQRTSDYVYMSWPIKKFKLRMIL